LAFYSLSELYTSFTKITEYQGGGFCGGLATHPGKTTIRHRNDVHNSKVFN